MASRAEALQTLQHDPELGSAVLDGRALNPAANARSASSATWRAIASEEVAAGEGALRTCRARSV